MGRQQMMVIVMWPTAVVMIGVLVFGLMQSPAPQATPAPMTPPPVAQPPVVIDWSTEPVVSLPPPVAKPPEVSPRIDRVPIDGEDLANVLGVTMSKFHYALPAGQYTCFIWTERWTRGATEPIVTLLASANVGGEGDVIVKLPTESDRQLYLYVGDAPRLNNRDADPLAPSGSSTAQLDGQTFAPGEAIHLVTVSYNLETLAIPALENIHTQRDMTTYVKTGFIIGKNTPFNPDQWTAPARK